VLKPERTIACNLHQAPALPVARDVCLGQTRFEARRITPEFILAQPPTQVDEALDACTHCVYATLWHCTTMWYLTSSCIAAIIKSANEVLTQVDGALDACTHCVYASLQRCATMWYLASSRLWVHKFT
jgi:hypothetical protein